MRRRLVFFYTPIWETAEFFELVLPVHKNSAGFFTVHCSLFTVNYILNDPKFPGFIGRPLE